MPGFFLALCLVLPLAGLLAKLVRLGQSELLLEGLLEPLLQPDASPVIPAYAHVFQSVGVQALERLVEGALVWLGGRSILFLVLLLGWLVVR